MAIPQHDEIVALGREPVSPERPVGDPCRYDEAFEELQGQLDRLGSLTGEEVQWPRVVALATDLLKNKSKDLLVLTYLVLGLFEQHGYTGLAAGCASYCEFLGNFWEKCFPKVKPPHGRYNAVQYLADRIHPLVELKGGQCKKPPGPNEKEAVHECAERIERLVQAVEAAFKELPDSPNLMPLNRAFRALREKVGPLGAVEPVAAAAPGVPAAGPDALAAGPPAAAAAPEAFASPTQAAQTIIRVAKFLFSQDNKDARPYLLLRAVHFGGLVEAPKDGLLPPVPPQRRQFFETLAASGNGAELLSEAEAQFAVTPLWLDLQRYVAVALKGLGPAYSGAHHAVVTTAVGLQARLPQLFETTFRDRSLFADGATKAWLTEASAESGGGGAGGAGGRDDALAEPLAAARKLLSESKSAEAVKCLAVAVDAAPGRSQRFQAQLALARLLGDMNRPNLARAMLEELEAQIDEFRLAEWEPGLAGEVLRQLYECLRKSQPKPTPEEALRSAQVFARLCRLDPAGALKLDSAAGKT